MKSHWTVLPENEEDLSVVGKKWEDNKNPDKQSEGTNKEGMSESKSGVK